MGRADMYFSVDVEADGPIPGPYSMVSIGIAAVGTFDGSNANRLAAEKYSFYRELKPISDKYIPEALSISGLTRDYLVEHGTDAKTAMTAAHSFVMRTAGCYKPVFVAYPLSFDWLFTYWYFMNFAGKSPFGFSSAVDLKTMIMTKTGRTLGSTSKRSIPTKLRSQLPHTHNALDDAIEQGETFMNVLRADLMKKSQNHH